jgi:hypothetical protein
MERPETRRICLKSILRCLLLKIRIIAMNCGRVCEQLQHDLSNWRGYSGTKLHKKSNERTGYPTARLGTPVCIDPK